MCIHVVRTSKYIHLTVSELNYINGRMENVQPFLLKMQSKRIQKGVSVGCPLLLIHEMKVTLVQLYCGHFIIVYRLQNMHTNKIKGVAKL